MRLDAKNRIKRLDAKNNEVGWMAYLRKREEQIKSDEIQSLTVQRCRQSNSYPFWGMCTGQERTYQMNDR